jgi:hypothetical protein
MLQVMFSQPGIFKFIGQGIRTIPHKDPIPESVAYLKAVDQFPD